MPVPFELGIKHEWMHSICRFDWCYMCFPLFSLHGTEAQMADKTHQISVCVEQACVGAGVAAGQWRHGIQTTMAGGVFGGGLECMCVCVCVYYYMGGEWGGGGSVIAACLCAVSVCVWLHS